MTTTDDARLLEIEAREQAATPGPWECEHEDYVSSVYLGSANAGSYPAQRAPIHRDTDFTDRQADEARGTVEFIAHSREDVRYLLDRLKAAEGDNAELTRQVFAAYRRAEAAESRIRAAKSVIGRWESYDSIHADASRALSQIEEALHSGEVQGEGNGG